MFKNPPAQRSARQSRKPKKSSPRRNIYMDPVLFEAGKDFAKKNGHRSISSFLAKLLRNELNHPRKRIA